MMDGYARDGRRERVTDLEWKTGARRVTETGALWRGYGRPAVLRIWEGSLSYRAGLDRADGRGFFAVEGWGRRETAPTADRSRRGSQYDCLIAEALGG